MAIHFRCGCCRHRVSARSRMAGLTAICPGCRHKIQIPSAVECRLALAELASLIDRNLIPAARDVSSAAAYPRMDKPHLPRPGLLAKTPAAAAPAEAEPALIQARGPTPATRILHAAHRSQPLANWSDRLGTGALFSCLAALLCAWIPRLCSLVIPLSAVGVLVGLSCLVLVSYAERKRLFVPTAGAAGSAVILLVALFFPEFLGSVYLASRDKGEGDPTFIRAVPIEGSPASLVPEWVDATKASLQQGQVNLQITRVSIRRAGAAKTTSGKKIASGEYCFVRLRTQAVVAASEFSAKRIQAQSSRDEDARLTLTDGADKTYEMHGVLETEAGDKKRKGPTFPVSFQDHVFVFEAPAARPNYLRLEIAAEPWGGKGAFRFTIPGSMIIDERGTLKKGS